MMEIDRETKILLLAILQAGSCDEDQRKQLAKAFNLNLYQILFGVSPEDDARVIAELVEKM